MHRVRPANEGGAEVHLHRHVALAGEGAEAIDDEVSERFPLDGRGTWLPEGRAGKPLVRVTAMTAEAPKPMRRFGFMKGQIQVPDDFNTMGAAEIEAMFYGEE